MLYVHVDDQAIAGASSELIDKFIDVFQARSPCKRQRNLQHFLGMEIHRNRQERKIWISQTQYAERVTKESSLSQCKTRSIPMSPYLRNSLSTTNPEAVHSARHLLYRELTGSLHYLSTTLRPDISFAVHRMSSFKSN